MARPSPNASNESAVFKGVGVAHSGCSISESRTCLIVVPNEAAVFSMTTQRTIAPFILYIPMKSIRVRQNGKLSSVLRCVNLSLGETGLK